LSGVVVSGTGNGAAGVIGNGRGAGNGFAAGVGNGAGSEEKVTGIGDSRGEITGAVSGGSGVGAKGGISIGLSTGFATGGGSEGGTTANSLVWPTTSFFTGTIPDLVSYRKGLVEGAVSRAVGSLISKTIGERATFDPEDSGARAVRLTAGTSSPVLVLAEVSPGALGMGAFRVSGEGRATPPNNQSLKRKPEDVTGAGVDGAEE
jgi:hypothetical protein